MKKFAFQAIILITVIFLALAIYTSRISPVPFIPGVPGESEVVINNTRIKVEVVDSKEERSKGLGGRDSLPDNTGMLFIFDKEDKYPFWMKGLKFPLDFVWIRGDTVVDFLEDIQPPQANQSDQSLPIYSSGVPIDKVLELNAGTIKRLDIKVGDKIQIVR